jgi:hypothetical protein
MDLDRILIINLALMKGLKNAHAVRSGKSNGSEAVGGTQTHEGE